jgi:hypothetical protein
VSSALDTNPATHTWLALGAFSGPVESRFWARGGSREQRSLGREDESLLVLRTDLTRRQLVSLSASPLKVRFPLNAFRSAVRRPSTASLFKT